MIPPNPFSTLARAVSEGAQPADLMPELHREVLTAAAARASVLLQKPRASGGYRATSGHGFPDMSGVWLCGAEATELEARVTAGAVVCDLAGLPGLQARLQASHALVVPVAARVEPAFLLVADPDLPAPRALEVGARARVEFGLALQMARLARQGALHRKLQELFLAFTQGISSTLSLGSALESLARDTDALFGSRRTSIWLHNRRARELGLAASSDPAHAGLSVATDSDTPAARGMRLDRPDAEVEIVRAPQGGDAEDERVLLAPLRGWRRALGTIVIEGGPADQDDREFADAAYELARQLSVAVENVQLLESVLQQRRLLEDTFNSLVDLVVVVDTARRVVQMNEAFASRAGSSRASLLQQPLQDLVGGEMAEWVAASERVRPSGDAPVEERTKRFTDARLGGIFTATVTPLINQDGDPVGQVLVARDITAQTRLEQEQAALRERLGQSEKLASLGQFVAGIAHEMNNPLQGVLGHLELLLTTSEAARPLRPTLRKIYQEGDRAAKIVRNLLVFAGSRRMARRAIRVERIIARALASRSAALRRARITVVRKTGADVPMIKGDALLLQQAFLNIVINAEHAMLGSEGERRLDIDVERAGSMVRVSMRDTGSGIPPDVLPRIFDPFFTTKDVGQGTGLGLAITYGIIQEHGGTIEARNSQGGGAEFTIELPVQV